MKIKSQKDFFSGLMFAVIGAAFALGATRYTMGSGARMGPGYFPLLLGVVLALLGLAIMARALVWQVANGDKIGPWAWRPLCTIIAANLAFGVLLGGLPGIKLPALGLIAAIVALTLIASKADGHFNLKESLMLAAVLSIGSYLAFVLLLKLQFTVWPTFISG